MNNRMKHVLVCVCVLRMYVCMCVRALDCDDTNDGCMPAAVQRNGAVHPAAGGDGRGNNGQRNVDQKIKEEAPDTGGWDFLLCGDPGWQDRVYRS